MGGDNILKIETDAGQQTRRLRFDRNAKPASARSLQGHSAAEWERPAGQGRGQAGPGGSLKVITNNLRAGWLRKNGVPYSENAVVTESYRPPLRRRTAISGSRSRRLSRIRRTLKPAVRDQLALRGEPDAAKWAPSPCRTT